MAMYDKSKYYVDFSDRDNLTNDEKLALSKMLSSIWGMLLHNTL